MKKYTVIYSYILETQRKLNVFIILFGLALFVARDAEVFFFFPIPGVGVL